MLKKYRLFIILFGVYTPFLLSAKSSLLVTNALNTLVKPVEQKAAVGMKIISLANDACLYQKNADQMLIPASTTKLFTSIAAFDILGPDFRFETQLLGENSSPTKIGNLYIRGGGDPSLETADLEELVKKLKARGIKEVKGNIIIDTTIFDTEPAAPGWSKNDGPIFDKSPVYGLMLNHCCMTILVKPARIHGHKPHIFLPPAAKNFVVENRARTISHPKKQTLHASRSHKSEKKIIVSGSIATKSKGKSYLVVLDNPHLYAAETLSYLLKKNNIIFRGSIIVGKTPQKVKVLARHLSEPVKSLMAFMMKTSDNLYADAFYKRMGALMYGEPGTYARGKKAVDTFLKNEFNFTDKKVDIYDGSGLSHTNRVSPNTLAEMLSSIYKKSPHRDVFIDSLPLSGKDGTLKRRMRGKLVYKRVKAKTGSLPGITSLAGYIMPQKGSPLIYVSVVNRKNKSALHFKSKLEDKACMLLAAYTVSTS